jgi:protein MpaA
MRRLAAALLVVVAVAIGLAARSPGGSPPARAASTSDQLPTTRRVLLGRSTEGRAIRAVRVGDPDSPRKALVIGAIHGNETQGLRITRALRRSSGVTGVDLWVVETVNPDGVARGSRGNVRGVDLNRNFSFRWRGGPGHGARPFSERETRVVRRWILRLRPAVTIWYHQPWNAVLACGSDVPMERRYGRIAGMRLDCRGRGLTGTASSWQNNVVGGGEAWVVEFASGPLSDARARRHARAAALVAEGR